MKIVNARRIVRDAFGRQANDFACAWSVEKCFMIEFFFNLTFLFSNFFFDFSHILLGLFFDHLRKMIKFTWWNTQSLFKKFKCGVFRYLSVWGDCGRWSVLVLEGGCEWKVVKISLFGIFFSASWGEKLRYLVIGVRFWRAVIFGWYMRELVIFWFDYFVVCIVGWITREENMVEKKARWHIYLIF